MDTEDVPFKSFVIADKIERLFKLNPVSLFTVDSESEEMKEFDPAFDRKG